MVAHHCRRPGGGGCARQDGAGCVAQGCCPAREGCRCSQGQGQGEGGAAADDALGLGRGGREAGHRRLQEAPWNAAGGAPVKFYRITRRESAKWPRNARNGRSPQAPPSGRPDGRGGGDGGQMAVALGSAAASAQPLRAGSRGPRQDHALRLSHRAQRAHPPQDGGQAAVHGLPGRRAGASPQRRAAGAGPSRLSLLRTGASP